MKITYLSTYLPKQCGIATYTDYLVHAIRRMDSSIDIKIVAEQGADPIREDKFEVVPSWERNGEYVEPILSQIKDAEVVHVQHEYSIYKFDDRLPSLLQKLDPNIIKVITIHCVRPAQFSERKEVDERFAAKIAQLANRVIVHLESQKAILTRLGIAQEKIQLIPHGTEFSNQDKEISRDRLGLPKEARILLMLGFIKPHKCIHIVLDAFQRIREKFKDVYLFLAGGLSPTASKKDRDYADAVAKKIEDLRLQEYIIYPKKFFPNEDVPYLLRASDIVLFPYYEEDRSASGSFHLALGANRPIIASRIPKFEELKKVCDELLVLPYNSLGIAQTAIRLFEDSKFREYVLQRTDEYRKITSWEGIARQHLELYKEN